MHWMVSESEWPSLQTVNFGLVWATVPGRDWAWLGWLSLTLLDRTGACIPYRLTAIHHDTALSNTEMNCFTRDCDSTGPDYGWRRSYALHNRIGPFVSHLSPNYAENKYVKRVTIVFPCVFEAGRIQCCQVIAWNLCFSAKNRRYGLLLTKLQCNKYVVTAWLSITYVQNIL